MRHRRAARPAGLALVLVLASIPLPVVASVALDAPGVAFRGASVNVQLEDGALESGVRRAVTIVTSSTTIDTALEGGTPLVLTLPARDLDGDLVVDGERLRAETRLFSGWLTLLPAILAIGTALLTRQVVLSLLVGTYVGALFLSAFSPLPAFTRTLETYVVGSLASDSSHVTIIFIASILGGMSGVISQSGGAGAIAARLAAGASNARRGLLSTWAAGLVIFFDDYANTLIVGNMMRPLTDKLRISREKLSFLVDATAAPVASLAPISTWIGFEVGLIQSALGGLGIERDAYELFLASVPYRFYPVFLLVFGLAVAWTGRDFGPMRRAEARARRGDGVLAPGAESLLKLDEEAGATASRGDGRPVTGADALNALIPILVVIVVTLGGIVLTGWQGSADDRSLRALFGAGDSYRALLWAGAFGSLAAVALAVGRRSLGLAKAVSAWVDGVRAMSLAVIILVLAWAIGAVCGDMGTADVVVSWLDDRFPSVLLPMAVFLISAAVSFATGTSWGTMAILMPLVVPLAHALSPGHEVILVGSISSVLAGSVFGDHCSPISDTTVLSSLATGADHMDHVRTQLPYALFVGFVAMLVGDLATAVGVPLWLSLALGVAIVVSVVRFVGRRPEPI